MPTPGLPRRCRRGAEDGHHHTMAPRKKQVAESHQSSSDSATPPKAYDDLAISRAIAKVGDADLRGFLEAVVDVVTGISGAQQNRNVEQRQALTTEVAQERQHVYETLRDVRYQYKQLNDAREADTNDRRQIALFLERQDTQLGKLAELPGKVEAVSTGQTELRADFRSVREAVDELKIGLQEVTARVDGFDGRLSTVEQVIIARPAQRRHEQDLMRRSQDELRATLARIESLLLTEEERMALRRLIEKGSV